MRTMTMVGAFIGLLTVNSAHTESPERVRAIDGADVTSLAYVGADVKATADAVADVRALGAQDPDDAAHAAEVLRSARGASPTLCAMAGVAIEQRMGGWYGSPPSSRAAGSDASARWARSGRLDDRAVPVLEEGLRDADSLRRA